MLMSFWPFSAEFSKAIVDGLEALPFFFCTYFIATEALFSFCFEQGTHQSKIFPTSACCAWFFCLKIHFQVFVLVQNMDVYNDFWIVDIRIFWNTSRTTRMITTSWRSSSSDAELLAWRAPFFTSLRVAYVLRVFETLIIRYEFAVRFFCLGKTSHRFRFNTTTTSLFTCRAVKPSCSKPLRWKI